MVDRVRVNAHLLHVLEGFQATFPIHCAVQEELAQPLGRIDFDNWRKMHSGKAYIRRSGVSQSRFSMRQSALFFWLVPEFLFAFDAKIEKRGCLLRPHLKHLNRT